MVELTLALAIAGVVSVPLSGIAAAQLRIPLEISAEVATASKIQSATALLLNDAVSSRSFTPGLEPDYGTFEWIEFADDVPVAVSSRYFWQDESLFRELTWDGVSSPPHLVKDDVEEFGDVVFQHTVSGWKIDPDTANWVYTGGQITVNLDALRETAAEVSRAARRCTTAAEESCTTGTMRKD